jgi:hypothetical protein
MNPSKANLINRVAELERELSVRDIYLSYAFKSEVTHITKGTCKLSVCAECAAHGGVVLESMRDNTGKWYVVGVYYWESFYTKVREYPARHDDVEAQDRRACASSVAKHVADKQAAFYAPRVAQAVLG